MSYVNFKCPACGQKHNIYINCFPTWINCPNTQQRFEVVRNGKTYTIKKQINWFLVYTTIIYIACLLGLAFTIYIYDKLPNGKF